MDQFAGNELARDGRQGDSAVHDGEINVSLGGAWAQHWMAIDGKRVPTDQGGLDFRARDVRPGNHNAQPPRFRQSPPTTVKRHSNQ